MRRECVAEPARSDGEAIAGDWRWGSPDGANYRGNEGEIPGS
ncbi:hypothetical protein [Scytonema sp. PRP1]